MIDAEATVAYSVPKDRPGNDLDQSIFWRVDLRGGRHWRTIVLDPEWSLQKELTRGR